MFVRRSVCAQSVCAQERVRSDALHEVIHLDVFRQRDDDVTVQPPHRLRIHLQVSFIGIVGGGACRWW